MPLEDICGMRLPKISDDAVLFMWTTAPMLENSFAVISAWGFRYVENIVWHKVKHNWGNYTSVRHEHLMIAVRGRGTPDCKKDPPSSVQTIERTEHSRKPEEFRAIIDRLYPQGQRIELFARGALPVGWDGFGNEYQKASHLAA